MTVDAIRRAEELWAVPFKRARGSGVGATVEAAPGTANDAGQLVQNTETPTDSTSTASPDAEAAPPRRRRRRTTDDEGTK